MTDRERYVQSVFETALFFREMWEEGGGGDTRAIDMLKPVKASATQIRQHVLQNLYIQQRLSLTECAIQLATWQPNSAPPSFRIVEIKDHLWNLCSQHERPFQPVSDIKELEDRAYLRLARQLRRISRKELGAHSRVFEFFIPNDFVQIGYGTNGKGHKEHVVPCVLLLEECCTRFVNGWSDNEVAEWVRQYLVIVEINKREKDRLDLNPPFGRGLKTVMPENWSFESGCIFARLHDAEIDFNPPNGRTRCVHQSHPKTQNQPKERLNKS